MDTLIETKLTVVGNGKTGKTSMLKLFKDYSFSSVYTPTSFDILTIERKYKKRTIKLNFWDTAGQEDFERLAPLHLPNTDLLVLCFSVCDLESYETLPTKWKTMIDFYCKDTPIVLIGCKTDLRHDAEEIKNLAEMGQSMISREMGEKMAKEIGALKYFECSAKNNEGGEIMLDFYYKWVYGNNVDGESEETEKKKKGFFNRIFRFCGCSGN